MLRVSMDRANIAIDLGAIVDPDHATQQVGADEIIKFTRALVGRTTDLNDARRLLVESLGEEATAAVAGSVGNFEMMNRILDATGVPAPGTMAEIREWLSS